MSLGIAFKGPEGIVLAADSRVTLMAIQPPPFPGQPPVSVPATFDNATKLLRVKGQDHVGAITYGLGAIGEAAPRTAHSFIPEFEAYLAKQPPRTTSPDGGEKLERLTVERFATELSSFFSERWKESMPAQWPQGAPDMTFLIGGYDPEAPYGRVFEFHMPGKPKPFEQLVGAGQFGLVWGGQREIVDRLLHGYDSRTLQLAAAELKLEPQQVEQLRTRLAEMSIPIPYQFLPLQDCVDLSIFLLSATIRLQTWMVSVRGVGGAIDVAAITKTDGFQPIQLKRLSGESVNR